MLALLGPGILSGVACASGIGRKGDCPRGQLAQCRFEQAIDEAHAAKMRKQVAEQKARAETQKKGWEFADELLSALAVELGDGMGGGIVHARSQTHCREAPLEQEARASSWVCSLDPPLMLAGHEFVLEFSPEGILSLASTQLDAVTSERLLQVALQRWEKRCEGDSFEAVDGETHHEFFRCALPEGPLLVVGRFDRDLAADLWQLSFALVAVG